MKIKKQLKNATFEYDEEKKTFSISGEHPPLRDTQNTVELNKVYAFAFMRFVVRMAQRNWLRSAPKKEKKEVEELAEHPFDAPNQTEFCYDALNEESREVSLPEGSEKKILTK
jgi:hypothetical protein